MADAPKLDAVRPDVKAMIDNVVVPILVREFVGKLRSPKPVELANQPVTPYGLANTAPAVKVAT
jgi:hypothetical protein